MNRPYEIEDSYDLNQIARLNPSDFYNFICCPLSEVFRANVKPKIPKNPYAFFGIAIHKFFESTIEHADINYDDEALISLFKDNIKAVKDEYREIWPHNISIAFDTHIPDFFVRMKKAIEVVKNISNSSRPMRRKASKNNNSNNDFKKTGVEILLSTTDGLISGRIDHVLYDNGEIIIRDYKTGIISSTKKLSERYAMQLKIYAWLYYDCHNIWPDKLEIRTINNETIPISYTKEEITQLINNGKLLLESTNERIKTIQNAQFNIARPSKDNCKFCDFRPYCRSYLEKNKSGRISKNDFIGNVIDKRKLKNGKLSITISREHEGDSITVIDLEYSKSRHPAYFNIYKNDLVGIFNTVKSGRNLRQGATTVIYKYLQ